MNTTMNVEVKKPTWWDTATPEQRAERVAKMNSGRAAAKAKREEAKREKYIDQAFADELLDDDILDDTPFEEIQAAVESARQHRALARPRPKIEPKNTTNTMYIVLEGGSTKDRTIDNCVYKICKTLEEAVAAMNARVDGYVTDYGLLEENPAREIPRVTVAKMEERIAKAWRGDLIFGVNVVDVPEEDEEDGEEENWDRGMWGNLLLTLQIKKE